MDTARQILKSFAGNHIVLIRELPRTFPWLYVPLEHNPADLIFRAHDVKKLASRALCWNGPSLLILNKRLIKNASNLTNSTNERYSGVLKVAKKLALSTNIDSNFFDIYIFKYYQ